LDDVQHDDHLAEDEHPVPGLLEPGEQLVQQNQLAGTIDQLLQPVLCRLLCREINFLHQLAVVASLPQLHEDVQQAGLLLPPAQLAVVLRQHQLVQLLLLDCHVHPQDLLNFLWHRFLHILFHPPDDVRFEEGVQLDVTFLPILLGSKLNLKLFPAANLVNPQVVEQTPQLPEVVLEWSAGEEKPMMGLHPRQDLVQQRVVALQPVRLVHHDVRPDHVLEEVLVPRHHFVAGQKTVETQFTLLVLALEFPDNLPRLGIPEIGDHVHIWGPL